ncbi:MAG TPA: DUF1674 domain-containing protein [Dongiaceae bacterium]|nr:DUF1674 domain-containing protein [Dongiaceae bacterium]
MRWSFNGANQGDGFAGEGREVYHRDMARPDSTDENASGPVANPLRRTDAQPDQDAARLSKRPREIGGPSGLEPTRYGDWERNGRVSDF